MYNEGKIMSKNKNEQKNNNISLGDDFLDDLLNSSDESNQVVKEEKRPVNESAENNKVVDSDSSEINSLEAKNLKELRQLAKVKGLSGYSKMKKEKLVNILSRPFGASAEEKALDEEDDLLTTSTPLKKEVLEVEEEEEEESFTAEEIMKENQEEEDEDNWILSGPPTLNDPTSVRDPVDILTQYKDERGKTIVTDKLLGSIKKRFNSISEIATLPKINELVSLAGIGEQTAQKIWKIAQQFHQMNAKTAKTLLKQKKDTNKCSTGSVALDELLGGGIEAKHLTEFFGEAGMGKTQICYTTAVMALLQKSEGGFIDFKPQSSQRPRVVWLDTESTFKSERIVEIVKNRYPNKDPDYFLDNIIYYQILSTDMLQNAIEEVFKMPDKIVLVIIDSIMSPFRFEFSHGVSELARRQNKLQEILGIIKRNMQINEPAILVTNQATTKMSMAGPISMTSVIAAGGFAVAHAVTHRIKLSKKSAGKNRDIVLRKATVVDSPYLAIGEAEFVLNEEGVSDMDKGNTRSKSTSSKVSLTVGKDIESEEDIEDDILA
ncbi:MAG: DNA repair and recombination protein RadA [Candidatus Heimdallarchaeota archaeon LC_3]|nr:MAG: DNA repair and recombination protein RadA [Candidatus Heimdallarchaeota archaeon LC_3]